MQRELKNVSDLLSKNSINYIHYYAKNNERKISFQQLLQDAGNLVSFFKQIGVKQDEAIGICNVNSYEWLVVDLACIIGGYMTVVFDSNTEKEHIMFYVERLHIRMIYSDHLHSISDIWVFTSEDICNYSQKKMDLDTTVIDPSDWFTVVFTSGTTGIPKAIVLKRTSIEHTINTAMACMEVLKDDCNLSFLPLSIFTTRMYIYGAYLFGYNVVLTTPDFLWLALAKYRPTIMQGVPYFFENYAHLFKKRIQENFLRRLSFAINKWLNTYKMPNSLAWTYKAARLRFGNRMRFMITGAAPISAETVQFYVDAGLDLLESYGLNETGIISTNLPFERKVGSVGKVLDGYEIKIDPDGRILVRSDYFWTDGYLTSDGLVRLEIDSDGFFCTGDVGHLDKEGFLFVTGRMNDVILLKNGKKINPAEVEKVLNSFPPIGQSLVFSNDQNTVSALLVLNITYAEKDAAYCIRKFNRENIFDITIRKFLIIQEGFSFDNGMLNTNLKLNRRKITETYLKSFEQEKGKL